MPIPFGSYKSEALEKSKIDFEKQRGKSQQLAAGIIVPGAIDASQAVGRLGQTMGTPDQTLRQSPSRLRRVSPDPYRPPRTNWKPWEPPKSVKHREAPINFLARRSAVEQFLKESGLPIDQLEPYEREQLPYFEDDVLQEMVQSKNLRPRAGMYGEEGSPTGGPQGPLAGIPVARLFASKEEGLPGTGPLGGIGLAEAAALPVGVTSGFAPALRQAALGAAGRQGFIQGAKQPGLRNVLTKGLGATLGAETGARVAPLAAVEAGLPPEAALPVSFAGGLAGGIGGFTLPGVAQVAGPALRRAASEQATQWLERQQVVTLYHGTNASAANSIKRNGLTPNSGLTTNRQIADLFAKNNYGPDAEVVEFRVPANKVRNPNPQETWYVVSDRRLKPVQGVRRLATEAGGAKYTPQEPGGLTPDELAFGPQEPAFPKEIFPEHPVRPELQPVEEAYGAPNVGRRPAEISAWTDDQLYRTEGRLIDALTPTPEDYLPDYHPAGVDPNAWKVFEEDLQRVQQEIKRRGANYRPDYGAYPQDEVRDDFIRPPERTSAEAAARGELEDITGTSGPRRGDIVNATDEELETLRDDYPLSYRDDNEPGGAAANALIDGEIERIEVEIERRQRGMRDYTRLSDEGLAKAREYAEWVANNWRKIKESGEAGHPEYEARAERNLDAVKAEQARRQGLGPGTPQGPDLGIEATGLPGEVPPIEEAMPQFAPNAPTATRNQLVRDLQAVLRGEKRPSPLPKKRGQYLGPALRRTLKALGVDTPQESKVNPEDIVSFAKVLNEAGEERVVAALDPRILKTWGGNLYDGDLGEVSVKEMLQNSVDAVRDLGKGGRVKVEWTTSTNRLKVTDNGHGMDPATASKEFVDIGGSYKPSAQASGGFGIAKVAIFMNSTKIKVVTVKDGVQTTLTGSGEDWLNPAVGLKTVTEKVNTPNGTVIDVKIKQGDPDVEFSDWVVSDWIERFQKTNTLDAQVKFIKDGEEFGRTRPTKFEEIHKDDIPGATIAYLTPPTSRKGNSLKVYVLNNGLPQFVLFKNLDEGMEAELPEYLIVDVRAKQSPEHANYPFSPNRQQLRDKAQDAVEKFVKKDLMATAARKDVDIILDAFNKAPRTATGLSIVDTTGKLGDFVRTIDMREYWDDMTGAAEKVFNRLWLSVKGEYPSTYAAMFRGIGLGDGYVGLNVRRNLFEEGAPDEVVMNPYLHHREFLASQSGDQEWDSFMAGRTQSTLLHEAIHSASRGHTETFSKYLTYMIGVLAPEWTDIHDQLRRVYTRIQDGSGYAQFERDARAFEQALIDKSARGINIVGRASDSTKPLGPSDFGGQGVPGATPEAGRGLGEGVQPPVRGAQAGGAGLGRSSDTPGIGPGTFADDTPLERGQFGEVPEIDEVAFGPRSETRPSVERVNLGPGGPMRWNERGERVPIDFEEQGLAGQHGGHPSGLDDLDPTPVDRPLSFQPGGPGAARSIAEMSDHELLNASIGAEDSGLWLRSRLQEKGAAERLGGPEAVERLKNFWLEQREILRAEELRRRDAGDWNPANRERRLPPMGGGAKQAPTGPSYTRFPMGHERLVQEAMPTPKTDPVDKIMGIAQTGKGDPVDPSDLQSLFDKLLEQDKMSPQQKSVTGAALTAVLQGKRPTANEIVLLRKVYGDEFADALKSRAGLGRKAWETFLNVANLPRALQSSWDLSAPLRQALVATVGHPKESVPAVATMIRSWFDEDVAKQVMTDIENSKYKDLKGELYIAPADGKMGTREEAFMSDLADWVPGVNRSQRAYITYLNKLRSDVFDTIAHNWEGTNKRQSDYDSLSRYLNHATGRGSLGKFEGAGPALNALFFSPRLAISRVQTPLDLITSTSAVRKEVAKDLAVTLSIGTTLLGMMALGGATVNLDPRSADFGKGKFGKQRIDMWGSHQQIMRYAAQMATGMVQTAQGKPPDYNPMDVLGRFLRSKLAPIPGLAADLSTGETFLGEEFRADRKFLGEEAMQRLTPLFWQDFYESVREEGFWGGVRATPGLFGVGSAAYDKAITQKLAEVPQYEGLPRDLQRQLLGTGQEGDSFYKEGFLDKHQKYRDEIDRAIFPDNVEDIPTSDTIVDLAVREGLSDEAVQWAITLSKPSEAKKLINPEWLQFVMDNEEELRREAPWIFDRDLEDFLDLQGLEQAAGQ